MKMARKFLNWFVIFLSEKGWVDLPEPEKAYQAVVPYLSKEKRLMMVQDSRLTVRPLLNGYENELFVALSIFIRDFKKHSLRFSPQVAMGEFLMDTTDTGERVDGTEAYHSINVFRNDFCIFDAGWLPLVVVEYNGAGHFGDKGDSRKMRKALTNEEIKRTACEKAGIFYFSLYPSQKTHEQMLRTLNVHVKPYLLDRLSG